MSEQRPYYHVAPVLNVPTVFASLEYPRDSPPRRITIDDVTWEITDRDDVDGKRTD